MYSKVRNCRWIFHALYADIQEKILIRSTNDIFRTTPGSLSEVEGPIDRRFDKLTDPKQSRIPERKKTGSLSEVEGSYL